MELLHDPVSLTQKLLAFDTTNSPGTERECAHFAGGLLAEAGFTVEYFEFAEGRTSVVARREGEGNGRLPICFSGHLDTVSLGEVSWQKPPLAGVIEGDKLYGRGASDMKAGVAAIIAAAVEAVQDGKLRAGITVVLTAGEEQACEGARHLVREPRILGPAGALVIGEPTSNQPIIAEKGILWLELITRGVAAHGSMPEQGVNAVYKAADAVAAIRSFSFSCSPHPILGEPTLNLGAVAGGTAFNIVPDKALLKVDIRLVPGQEADDVIADLQAAVGGDVEIRQVLTCPPVESDPTDPWVQEAAELLGKPIVQGDRSLGVPYFTDAAYLVPAFGGVPCLILGPGEPALAHKVDEYCLVSRICEAKEHYLKIARRWCEV